MDTVHCAQTQNAELWLVMYDVKVQEKAFKMANEKDPWENIACVYPKNPVFCPYLDILCCICFPFYLYCNYPHIYRMTQFKSLVALNGFPGFVYLFGVPGGSRRRCAACAYDYC